MLRAAARVVAEHGWHDVTLERVAEAAGVARTTLYRRGVTKELLLDALRVGAVQAYQAALWPALTAPGTGLERLRLALHSMCDVMEAHLGVLSAMSNVPDPVFHLDAPEHGARDIFVAPLARLLVDGVADGSLTASDPQETAELLLNVVTRTYAHLRTGHAWSAERAAGRLVDLTLAGVEATSQPAAGQ